MQTNALKPIVWGGGMLSAVPTICLLAVTLEGPWPCGHESVEGEYYLCKNWKSSFLGRPTYIWIRNGIEGHKEVKGSAAT